MVGTWKVRLEQRCPRNFLACRPKINSNFDSILKKKVLKGYFERHMVPSNLDRIFDWQVGFGWNDEENGFL